MADAQPAVFVQTGQNNGPMSEQDVARKLRFSGESHHKVDTKGRVSIPAPFRRVLSSADPDFVEGGNPQVFIVYGGESRNYLECFTMDGIDRIHDKIDRMKKSSKQRRALQELYNVRTVTTSVDETGRLVLSAKLRNKIGLNGEALFVGQGETFEIWDPAAYESAQEERLAEDDDFDPSVDAEEYLEADDFDLEDI